MKNTILLLTALITCFNGYSQTAEEYINMANSNIQSQNYTGALEDVNKAIELDPTNGKYFTIKGLVKFALSDTRGAVRDLDKAIKLNPDYALAYTKRGNVKISQEKYKEAISDLNKAIELQPELAEAYYQRGLAKTSMYYNELLAALEKGEAEKNAEERLSDKLDAGCLDLSKAGDLGYSDAYIVIEQFCN